MKKLLLISIFGLILGCQGPEHKQHPTTANQMQQIAKWHQSVEQRFGMVAQVFNDMASHHTDPNEVKGGVQ